MLTTHMHAGTWACRERNNLEIVVSPLTQSSYYMLSAYYCSEGVRAGWEGKEHTRTLKKLMISFGTHRYPKTLLGNSTSSVVWFPGDA